MLRRSMPLCLAALLCLGMDAGPALRVVDLHGTPRQRGLRHGRALAVEIRAMVPGFERDLEALVGEPAATFVPRFLKETRFEEAIRRHTPELLEEVRGLAEGAGQSFETMLAYQLVDELWAQAPGLAREKCTSLGLAARGGQPTVVAQNLDIPGWMHGHPTVLRVRHAGRDLQSLVVTVPGLIGAMGVNSRRVAVAVNTILQLAPRPDGLPVAFVVRGLLEQPDDEAARAFLAKVPHASGQAYTIGGPGRVTCHEASAGGVAPFIPPSGPDRVWHTNHPVASKDWAPAIRQAAERSGRPPVFACPRFQAARALLGSPDNVDVKACAAVLADPQHGVCNPSTYVCAVVRLGRVPELRVTPGRPDRTGFQRVPFAARTRR